MVLTSALMISCKTRCDNNASVVPSVSVSEQTVEAHFPQFAFAVTGISVCVLGFLGIIGNVISALVLLRPKMKGSVSVLLITLTAWDTIFIVTTILIFGLPAIFKYLNSGENFVKFFHPLTFPFTYAIRCTAQVESAYFTVVVTVERYIAVCKPLQARVLCTVKRAIYTVIFTSFVIIVYNVPRWFDWRSEPIYDDSLDQGVIVMYKLVSTEWRNVPSYKSIYLQWGFVVINYVIPFIIICVLNTIIARQVQKVNRFRKEVSSTQDKELSFTIMFLCVATIFLACTGYLFIVTLVDTFWDVPQSNYLWAVAKLLVTFNSSINCFIYCAFGKKFRNECLAMLTPRCVTRARMGVGTGTDSMSSNVTRMSALSITSTGI